MKKEEFDVLMERLQSIKTPTKKQMEALTPEQWETFFPIFIKTTVREFNRSNQRIKELTEAIDKRRG